MAYVTSIYIHIQVFGNHCTILSYRFLKMFVSVHAGVRQTPVMSASTRLRLMLSETAGSQILASYASVCLTLLFSAPPIVHIPSLDVLR